MTINSQPGAGNDFKLETAEEEAKRLAGNNSKKSAAEIAALGAKYDLVPSSVLVAEPATDPTIPRFHDLDYLKAVGIDVLSDDIEKIVRVLREEIVSEKSLLARDAEDVNSQAAVKILEKELAEALRVQAIPKFHDLDYLKAIGVNVLTDDIEKIVGVLREEIVSEKSLLARDAEDVNSQAAVKILEKELAEALRVQAIKNERIV